MIKSLWQKNCVVVDLAIRKKWEIFWKQGLTRLQVKTPLEDEMILNCVRAKPIKTIRNCRWTMKQHDFYNKKYKYGMYCIVIKLFFISLTLFKMYFSFKKNIHIIYYISNGPCNAIFPHLFKLFLMYHRAISALNFHARSFFIYDGLGIFFYCNPTTMI